MGCRGCSDAGSGCCGALALVERTTVGTELIVGSLSTVVLGAWDHLSWRDFSGPKAPGALALQGSAPGPVIRGWIALTGAPLVPSTFIVEEAFRTAGTWMTVHQVNLDQTQTPLLIELVARAALFRLSIRNEDGVDAGNYRISLLSEMH